MINSYVNTNSKEMEDGKNIVLITGFLNYNLLSQLEQSYNLPLYEINHLINLGKSI